MALRIVEISDDLDALDEERKEHRRLVLEELMKDPNAFASQHRLPITSSGEGAQVRVRLPLKPEYRFAYGDPFNDDSGEGTGSSSMEQERGDQIGEQQEGEGEGKGESGEGEEDQQEGSGSGGEGREDSDQQNKGSGGGRRQQSQSGDGEQGDGRQESSEEREEGKQEGEGEGEEDEGEEEDDKLKRGQEVGRLPENRPGNQPYQGPGDEGDEAEEKEKGDKGDQRDGNEAGNEAGNDSFETDISIDDIYGGVKEEFNLPDLDERQLSTLRAVRTSFPSGFRRKGPMSNLSGSRTAEERLKRLRGQYEELSQDVLDEEPWYPEDFRFRRRQEDIEYITNAVVYVCRDRSGSVGEEKKAVIRALSSHIVRAIRKVHKEVVVVFVTFDIAAKEWTEEEFFYMRSEGGTRISSGSEKILDISRERFPPEEWNSFTLFFTDGENLEEDMPLMKRSFQELCQEQRLVAYFEVFPSRVSSHINESGQTVSLNPITEAFREDLEAEYDNFVSHCIMSDDGVADAFEKLIEAAVNLERKRGRDYAKQTE